MAFLLLLAKLSLYAAELNPVLSRRLYPRALPMVDEPTEADLEVLTDIVKAEQRRKDQVITVGYGDPASGAGAASAAVPRAATAPDDTVAGTAPGAAVDSVAGPVPALRTLTLLMPPPAPGGPGRGPRKQSATACRPDGTYPVRRALGWVISLVGRLVMKPDIHPDYHPVVFRDRSADFVFLTRSTLTSDRTIEWEDGNTYPVIDVEISSASHPFYTGKSRVVDTAGRVERFRQRYGDNPGGSNQGAGKNAKKRG